MEFEPVLLQKFVNCNPQTKEPVFATYIAQVIKGTAVKEQTQAAQLAGIEGQRCKECNAVATVPEWWQLRPEAKRKQAVLISREIRLDGTIGSDYYPITIPHFNQSTPPGTPPLPEYEKGNFEGILTLKDNSKVIVHCKNAEECSRVLGAISVYIDDDYLVGSTSKIGQRRNMAFKAIRVKAWRLDYYPSGVQSMKPAWLKSYF